MKRYRQPKQIPNMLRMQWGKLKDSNPDVVYSWGAGCEKCDAHLLHNVLCSPRFIFQKLEKSLIDELTERGYDITTLKFSIKKRAA